MIHRVKHKTLTGSLFMGLLFIIAIAPSQVLAGDVDFGGEVRLRSETTSNFETLTGGENETFVLMRVRAHIDAEPVEDVGIFIQPQFSRKFAQEQSTVANGVAIDDLDLHQGYIDLKNVGGYSLLIRAGRQELSYGNQRLLGAFGWSNIGRAHDGVKLRYRWEKLWLDGFFSWIQDDPNDTGKTDNQYLSGLYAHWNKNDKTDYEFYLLSFNDKFDGLGSGDLNLYTVGNLLERRVGAWDYNSEVAIQFGKSGIEEIFAYAAHVAGGYTFDVHLQPRLGLEYNVASGDDTPGTGTSVKTFNNLFPTNHDKYGYMDLVGWRNIHNGRASVRVQPTDSVTTQVDYHIFYLMQEEDGLYAASGKQLRAGTAGASQYVGQEIDTTLKYKMNPFANLLIGYSFFNAGDFLDDTGDAEDAHFAYLQLTASY